MIAGDDSTKKRHCLTCGASIVDEEFRFCPYCGDLLEAPLDFVTESLVSSPDIEPPSLNLVNKEQRERRESSESRNKPRHFLILLNYMISLSVFIILLAVLHPHLSDDNRTLVIMLVLWVAAFIGGFVTKQHVPPKVVAVIFFLLVGIGTPVISFLVVQYHVSKVSTIFDFIVLMAIVAGMLATILFFILIYHTIWSYVGAKSRK